MTKIFSARGRLSTEERELVSAAWSAKLRAKVAASEAERRFRQVSVVVDFDADDDSWWSGRGAS